MAPELNEILFTGALLMVSVALIWAAWSDLRTFTIPNSICAAIAAAYPLALLALPPHAWFMGLATGAVVLMAGAVLFAQEWVGGGDVKLASAVALWAGPTLFANWVMVTSIAGALLALAILVTPLPRVLASCRVAETGFNQPMPFGVALAAGGLWVVVRHFTLI